MENSTLNYWIENKQSLLKEYNNNSTAYSKTLASLVSEIESSLKSVRRDPLVKGRVKNFTAFFRKVLSRCGVNGYDNPFETITDIIGIRIVVPFLEDINTVYRVLEQHYSILEFDQKSRELSVKEFGYDSLHLLIRIPDELQNSFNPGLASCEIQLRTILQDAWAEVEHELVYKTSFDKVEDSIRRKLTALNATLSLADITFQEIRDYQKKRYSDLQEKQKLLLKSVSIQTEHDSKLNNLQPTTQTDTYDNSAFNIHEADLNEIFMEALNAHLAGNLNKALELYTHLILISPNHYLYNHRGLVNLSLSNYDAALKDFTMAISIEPNDIRSYTNRGLTNRMLKRFQSALDDFDQTIRINPLWADAFYGKSLTHYDMGDIKAAIEDCDHAIAINESFTQALKFKQFLLNRDI